ncbi:lytic polysaccharide monooxygenase [Bacillus carboniphilus]|uniref:Lytic polysaccharide monooxygenase n=1 Tax=Bacillus carboniphilus TaxID=86663 RepID=A0ABY9JSU5_9BACI|nr:lytic polysaccharide monooxygenase [Bacillus carboniphilus]WLR42469.1 lytic polysaccharide monooxygenase [Bacillus carboniphilus]
MSLIKTSLKAVALLSAIGIGATISADQADAHGYIEEPASRAYTGSLMKEELGYYEALEIYGFVINSPHAVEGPKGFPEDGPQDGQIASAEGGFGQIDYVMDNQTEDRWIKQDMNSGVNTFTWNYTAPHATSKWHYYITKVDWNPNSPLKSEDFELIGTVEHDGSATNTNLSHDIEVPDDRSGYHIILGVWDVADTDNAFYQVIDVNLNNVPSNNDQATDENDADTSDDTNDASNDETNNNDSSDDATNEDSTNDQAVTAPTGLHVMEVTNQTIDLMWTASENAKHYEIYRDGEKVGQTTETRFIDEEELTANTAYEYYVKAVDSYNNASDSSNVITTKTAQSESNDDSSENTDENSENGHDDHNNTNDDASNNNEGNNESASVQEWDATKIYVEGDQVEYNGALYEALWWTQNKQPEKRYGWKLVSDTALEWDKETIYTGGSTVEYNGKTYKAKWWTQGDTPGSHMVWEEVK